jgi:hypothetical protein
MTFRCNSSHSSVTRGCRQFELIDPDGYAALFDVHIRAEQHLSGPAKIERIKATRSFLQHLMLTQRKYLFFAAPDHASIMLVIFP